MAYKDPTKNNTTRHLNPDCERCGKKVGIVSLVMHTGRSVCKQCADKLSAITLSRTAQD